MARIRIEDLPPVEDLTPEEMEEIFGAGLKSFRPTFEALEARELMDAGLRGALFAPLTAHAGGDAPRLDQVRVLETPVQTAPTQQVLGQGLNPLFSLPRR
jgi:hypothetical protein